MSTALTSRQRAVLRSLAQTIRPVLHVGRDGVTEAVAQSVMLALNTRELLKVKVLETAPGTATQLGEALATAAGAQLVQVIGRAIVLYRRHPDTPVIRLPSV